MATVGRGPPPFRAQVVVVRRQSAGPVPVALRPRDGVIAEEDQAPAEAAIEADVQPVEGGSGRRLDLIDGAFIRKRPRPRAGWRRVDVAQAELTNSSRVEVRERPDQASRQLP